MDKTSDGMIKGRPSFVTLIDVLKMASSTPSHRVYLLFAIIYYTG
jgi:hypothetical protein